MASPPRAQFYNIGQDASGNAVTTTRVTVYVAVPYAAAPQTTIASIYSAETGAGTPGNPFNATTGEINFWAGSGSYDIKIEDTGVPAKFATKIVRWDCQPGDEGILASMLVDGQIDLTKLATSVASLLLPAGSIIPYGGAAAPTNFLLCDGAAVSRTTYAALFAAIGTAFGTGDGSTTFNLPDLRGRVAVGVDGTAGRISNTPDGLGGVGGEERHTMTLAELVQHQHTSSSTYNGPGFAAHTSSFQEGTPGNTATINTGNVTGANATPFNVMQPYQIVNYMIKSV